MERSREGGRVEGGDEERTRLQTEKGQKGEKGRD